MTKMLDIGITKILDTGIAKMLGYRYLADRAAGVPPAEQVFIGMCTDLCMDMLYRHVHTHACRHVCMAFFAKIGHSDVVPSTQRLLVPAIRDCLIQPSASPTGLISKRHQVVLACLARARGPSGNAMVGRGVPALCSGMRVGVSRPARKRASGILAYLG